jgi:E3 ubiquitin-protein ligase RAD18
MPANVDPNTVADSTDWLTTPLSGLAALESSLRCHVCKEIFNNPMITSCAHTFCSICIRRCLSQEGKCPACWGPDQEMKLRHNWAVQELVGIWLQERAGIYNFATSAHKTQTSEPEPERPKKRRRTGKEDVVIVQKSGLEERRSTRSQSRRGASQASVTASQSPRRLPSTQEEVADSDADSIYMPSPKRPPQAAAPLDDGLIACPNCNRRTKEASINTHLDRCLQGLASSPDPPLVLDNAQAQPTATRFSSPPAIQAGTIAYTQRKPTSTQIRLPTINYSLLNENALRRKLKELGIPNTGTKELMRKRHAEWVNIYNANCDSLQPVSKMKLLQDLTTWERSISRDERTRTASQVGASSNVASKEFDREGYMSKEKDNFADLIRQARESRAKKAVPAPTEAKEEAVQATGAADADQDDVTMDGIEDTVQDGATPETAVVLDAGETLVPGTPPLQPGNSVSEPPEERYFSNHFPAQEQGDLKSAQDQQNHGQPPSSQPLSQPV